MLIVQCTRASAQACTPCYHVEAATCSNASPTGATSWCGSSSSARPLRGFVLTFERCAQHRRRLPLCWDVLVRQPPQAGLLLSEYVVTPSRCAPSRARAHPSGCTQTRSTRPAPAGLACTPATCRRASRPVARRTTRSATAAVAQPARTLTGRRVCRVLPGSQRVLDRTHVTRWIAVLVKMASRCSGASADIKSGAAAPATASRARPPTTATSASGQISVRSPPLVLFLPLIGVDARPSAATQTCKNCDSYAETCTGNGPGTATSWSVCLFPRHSRAP